MSDYVLIGACVGAACLVGVAYYGTAWWAATVAEEQTRYARSTLRWVGLTLAAPLAWPVTVVAALMVLALFVVLLVGDALPARTPACDHPFLPSPSGHRTYDLVKCGTCGRWFYGAQPTTIGARDYYVVWRPVRWWHWTLRSMIADAKTEGTA